MRIISLSIRRLRLYFLDNPLVSSLYILSGVVSILLILMLYPYVMPHMQRYSEANQSYRYFRYILDEESTDYQGLYEIVNDVDTYEITLSNYESSISHTEDSFELMTAISLGDSRVQNFKTSDLAQSLEENEIMAPENTTSIASDEGSANTVKLGADDPFSYTIRDRWNDSRYLIHPETFQSRYGFTFISFYIEEPATPEYSFDASVHG